MAKKRNNKNTEDLLKAVLALKDPKEAGKFFRDLLTENELAELGNRWQAARMLSQKASYTEIIKRTGLSSATVARISSWLKQGMGGYGLMLKRLHHHNPSPDKKGLR